jgi:hypothetical protein
MVEHLYTFEKQKINLFNNMFQDIYSDYYHITTVTCTYQKSSSFECALVTCALSYSCFSCLSATRFDF